LYLVSRALDDVRKIPLLGLQRAVERGWENDTDQWPRRITTPCAPGSPSSRQPVAGRGRQRARQQEGQDAAGTARVVRQRHRGHRQTITRIAGAELVAPIEWLDY